MFLDLEIKVSSILRNKGYLFLSEFSSNLSYEFSNLFSFNFSSSHGERVRNLFKLEGLVVHNKFLFKFERQKEHFLNVLK